MGREIRRVPVGFDHPVGEKWPGFLNPHHPRKCPGCENGYSEAAQRYSAEWYGNAPFDPRSTGSKPFGPDHPAVIAFAKRNVGHSPDYYGTGERAIKREAERLARDCFDNHWSHHLSQTDVDALIKAGRLMDFTHTWKAGEGWKPKDPPYKPTAEEVNVWSINGFGGGHDSINCWVCVEERCKRNGEPYVCATCGGKACDPADAETYRLMKEWQATDPPTGEAYQLWETVSEGSPITPAFATAEELARYCEANQFNKGRLLSRVEPWNDLAGGTERLSYDQWMKFIVGPGWAPSMVSSPERGFQSGVAEAVTR